MIDLMENITIPMNIKDVSVYVADKLTEISREEENSEVTELLSEINASKESIESKQSEIDELLINYQDLINRGLSIIEETKYAYDSNNLNEEKETETNTNTNDDISEVVEEVPINNELPADTFDDSAPLEEEKEEAPEEEVVTEVSQEEPVQDEVVAEETTDVQLPTVEEENQEETEVSLPTVDENQEEAEVSLPAVDENQEEAVNETEVQYMRDSDNNTDKAVSITNDQKVKLDASYDTQKALLDGGSTKEEVSETPVVEASSEEPPIAVELPVVENATVNTESNPQEELEKMSQEYSAALASGDEAKAEELSNAISEKNKQLQKVA